jgi:hypothetical protein
MDLLWIHLEEGRNGLTEYVMLLHHLPSLQTGITAIFKLAVGLDCLDQEMITAPGRVKTLESA